MSTVTLYSSDETGSLALERSKNRCTLRSTIDTVTVPIMRCSRAHLALFFADMNGYIHDHAWRLDWTDTSNVIENVVGDIADTTVYKPSSIMHYTAQIAASEDGSTVSLNFSTYYHLWKKAESGSSVTFEDVISETRDYCYTMEADTYLKLLYLATITSGDVATNVWNCALNNDFVMEEDYDFGDMDEDVLAAIYTDLDFGED